MDIVLDLWIHTIYNDRQGQDFELGPVVYFCNCTDNPLNNLVSFKPPVRSGGSAILEYPPADKLPRPCPALGYLKDYGKPHLNFPKNH